MLRASFFRLTINDMNSEQNETRKPGLLRGHLPLETETCFFILANALDAIMTRVLLRLPQFRESNEIADSILDRFGMPGMIAFKFIIVAAVVIIAQVIARRKLHVARYLLIGGTIIVFAVVIYSGYLWVAHSGFFFDPPPPQPAEG